MSTAPKPAPATRAKEIPIREVSPPDVRQHMETLLRIPPDLLRRLFLPDLSIAVVNVEGNTQVTYCNRVTFDVTLSPGLIPSSGNVPVRVRVTDKVFGLPQPVGDLTLYLPGTGGTARTSVQFPMPADANFQPDWGNEITVEVDPDNLIAESDESNNTLVVTGTCVG
jgi:CARDB protein